MPDLMDFIVTRNIPANYTQLESAFEFSSDHTTVIATLSATTIPKPPTPKLTTSHTNWDMFSAYINESINLHLCIKIPTELWRGHTEHSVRYVRYVRYAREK